MFTSEESLTLANFGEGAVNEIFDRELQRVLKDIMDPNTEATAQREVTLKIVIKPDEERDLGVVGVKASSRLAGSRAFISKLAFGHAKSGKVEARECFSGQRSLFDEDDKKVVPITGKEKHKEGTNVK